MADLVIMAGLSVAAFVLRRWSLPQDGIGADDAWVVGGAIFGSLGDVARTGGAHPGFTTFLRLQHQLIGGPVERLALLAFVAGVLGPAFVYAALRLLRYRWASSALAAAAVAVTHAHIVYSGRVKSYTLDVVGVMAIAAALPRLARPRWEWRNALAWLAVAVVVGSFSGYLMLASALAMGILVLHAQGDRVVRVVALVIQGAVHGGWVLYTRQYVDLDEIEEFMKVYDAHVDRSANPFVLAGNVFDHLKRVVDVHPGAPDSLLGVVAVGVVLGLVLGALGRLDHDRALVSRFALAALVIAALGGVLHRFPFGPATNDLSTAMGAPGARHGLWLLPVTAVGLCNLVDLTVGSVAKRQKHLRPVLNGVVATVAVLLAVGRWEPAPNRGHTGAHALTNFVDDAAADGAYIVLDGLASFGYLLLTDRPVDLVWTPEEMVGYLPVPDPEEGVVLGPYFTDPDIGALLATTDRTELVLIGLDVPYGDELRQAGWEKGRSLGRGGYRATVWTLS